MKWNDVHTIGGDIEELRSNAEKAFRKYKKAEGQFYENLKLWLLSAPLLQDEDPQLVEDICAAVATRIKDGGKIGKVTELVGQIARKKVAQARRKRGKEFDPALADKLSLQAPRGFSGIEVDEVAMKKLSPIYRLLISLQQRGMSKTMIAKLLFVTPARVTQYFDQAKKEIHELGGENV